MSTSRFVCDPIAACGGMFIVSARDVIEYVDSSACTLLGYAEEELIGLHGSELVPLDAHAATAVSLDLMRRGEVTHRLGRLRHKNGTTLELEVTGRPLPAGRLRLEVHYPRG